MKNWRIGLSTGCFYNRSILDCLHADSRERLQHDRSLLIADTSGFSRRNRGAPGRRNESKSSAWKRIRSTRHSRRRSTSPLARPHSGLASVAEITKAANAAAILSAHYFVLHPGPENHAAVAAEEQLPRMENVIRSLNQIAQHCNESGIVCALENKLPHLLFGNTSEILWILDGINSAEVGACLDTGHAFLSGDMYNLDSQTRQPSKTDPCAR